MLSLPLSVWCSWLVAWMVRDQGSSVLLQEPLSGLRLTSDRAVPSAWSPGRRGKCRQDGPAWEEGWMSSKALGRPCPLQPLVFLGRKGCQTPPFPQLFSEDGSFQEAMALSERQRPTKASSALGP